MDPYVAWINAAKAALIHEMLFAQSLKVLDDMQALLAFHHMHDDWIQ